MRPFGIAALAWLAVAGAASAQNTAPIVVPPAPSIMVPPAPSIMVPPAPPIMATPLPSAPAAPAAAPQVVPPPGLQQTPAPDTDAGATAAPAGNADNGAPAAAAAPPPADSWVPGATAELGVLNEVDGSVSQLKIPVGGQANVGDLQVSVLACLRRPPDQIPDAAAFVAAQASAPAPGPPPPGDAGQAAVSDDDSQDAAAPGYRGWMLRSAPGAAVVGDASETFRIIDCL